MTTKEKQSKEEMERRRPSGIVIIPLSFHSGNILGLLLLLLLPCLACVRAAAASRRRL
jgi:hypothetical protein